MIIKSGRRTWYDAYVPFVARSAESQVAWLISAFQKEILSPQEITPYIRLLLTEDTPGKLDNLAELFSLLDDEVLAKMLVAADIYEVPKIFVFIVQPTVRHALLALEKSPAPYEKNPRPLIHKVFQAIHNAAEGLLDKAVTVFRQQGMAPAHFEAAYEGFLEVIEDQKLLSSLYPKARAEVGR